MQNDFTQDELLYFPKLTEVDLHKISLGVYQIKNSKSYTAEEMEAFAQCHIILKNKTQIQNKFNTYSFK